VQQCLNLFKPPQVVLALLKQQQGQPDVQDACEKSKKKIRKTIPIPAKISG
jgi:hypothetical protein